MPTSVPNASEFGRALKDALKCCETTAPEAEFASKGTTSSSSSEEIRALAKDLGTLVHSHCTKLSLAAKPPRTQEAVDASIAELYKLLPVFASLCQSLDSSTMGLAFSQFIKNQARYVLIGLQSMVAAVQPGADAERLSKTGILWESCLELQKVERLDVIMSRKIEECLAMVNDAVDDLQSFLNDDLDDNFQDLSISATTDENDNTTDGTNTARRNSNEIPKCISMLTRVTILLKAIKKRKITPTSEIQMMNAIYSNLSQLNAEVDDLAVEIQESADPAFIMELEKVVVHRVEELLTATISKTEDGKWHEWISNFRSKWRIETSDTVES